MTISVDSNYKKKVPASDDESARLAESAFREPAKQMSPIIAHELNNILAIVQGYADRLRMKYADDTTLTSELKLITEAARRAAIIIRNATPQSLTRPAGQVPRPEPEPEPSLA